MGGERDVAGVEVDGGDEAEVGGEEEGKGKVVEDDECGGDSGAATVIAEFKYCGLC